MNDLASSAAALRDPRLIQSKRAAGDGARGGRPGQFNSASVIAACALLLLICLWSGMLVYLKYEKAYAYRTAEQKEASFARALEEHTLSTVRGIDQTTIFVKEQFERAGGRLELGRYGQQGVFLGKFFNLIGIIDADGWFILSDRPLPTSNLSDREHFLTHVATDTGKLFISKPVLGRSSGKWSVQFTRRVNTPSGDFGGVVVASLDPGYFNHFYQSIDIGEDGVVSLVGTDGIVRARSNGGGAYAGHDLRASQLFQALPRSDHGSYYATSQIDGVRRLFSYRKLADYPLVVVVGISEETLLREFFEHRNVMLGLGALITLLIIVAGGGLAAHARDQQRVEQALRMSEQEAVSASRMKSEFLARMSHELRTPLNGILGFAEFLRDTGESAEKREWATTIYESGSHLLTLVNTILDLAKIEAGHMDVNRQPVELEAMVNQVIAVQRAFATRKNLQLKANFAPSAPKTIDGDATKLVQVMNNLVHNAVKFTERGSIEVHVRMEPGEVVFVVADTGPGIPTCALSLVFDRFRQIDSFATRAQSGTGLGLALAREMVELMGGRIWVNSRTGEGSAFHFTIPCLKGSA